MANCYTHVCAIRLTHRLVIWIFDIMTLLSVITRAKVIWQKVTSRHPHFCGRGGCWGSVMVLFERVMVFSYRLFIMTIALSNH